eukprot:2298024-Prorocentrum_lima.AAC.1
MTSSLVGSEMCIRDRPCSALQGPRCKTLPPVANVLQGHSPSDVIHSFAVSYTHLTLPTICSV